jgi:hypothetical protein
VTERLVRLDQWTEMKSSRVEDVGWGYTFIIDCECWSVWHDTKTGLAYTMEGRPHPEELP